MRHPRVRQEERFTRRLRQDDNVFHGRHGASPEIVSAAATAVVEDLKSPLAVSAALESLSAQMGGPLSEFDPDTHVGLILADGLSGAEEAIMQRIRDLTDLPFVGGIGR